MKENMYTKQIIKEWKALNDALKALDNLTALTWNDELDEVYWTLQEQEQELRNMVLYSENIGVKN